MSYRRILIPLDGSELAEQAIDAALPLARAFDGELLLVGVVDLVPGVYDAYAEAFQPLDLKEPMEKFLQSALERAAGRPELAGTPVRSTLETGVPHEEIAALAEREASQLIVMTTHGRRGLSHLLLGSVAEKVIRTAPCPVLVVRPGEGDEKVS